MKSFMISGIQQIGVGTIDFRKSWNWYIEMFGIDIRILEDDTVAERMLPYTGGKPWKRHTCIAVNLQGGGEKRAKAEHNVFHAKPHLVLAPNLPTEQIINSVKELF